MRRFRFTFALSIAVVAVAACGASPIKAPAPPSASPVGPSASPSTPSTVTPPPTVTPAPATPQPPAVTPAPAAPQPVVKPPPAAPRPTQPPAVGTPRPTAPDFGEGEQYLLDGVQRGTKNCQPASGSDELPESAVAGIECDSSDPGSARIGFYLFANDDDMLSAYLDRMRSEGVAIDSGSCDEGEAEHAYIQFGDFASDRAGCFLNDEGLANYRYTMTVKHVLVGILGRSDDMAALESFAFVPHEDFPGSPTLWSGGID